MLLDWAWHYYPWHHLAYVTSTQVCLHSASLAFRDIILQFLSLSLSFLGEFLIKINKLELKIQSVSDLSFLIAETKESAFCSKNPRRDLQANIGP